MPEADTKPDVIPPKGLNPDRQWYLYEQIRPFCPPSDQDTTCPLPTVPRRGGSKRGTPHPEELPNPPATPPPPKRQRTCGIGIIVENNIGGAAQISNFTFFSLYLVNLVFIPPPSPPPPLPLLPPPPPPPPPHLSNFP